MSMDSHLNVHVSAQQQIYVLTRKLQHEAEAANDVVFSVKCGEVSKRNR